MFRVSNMKLNRTQITPPLTGGKMVLRKCVGFQLFLRQGLASQAVCVPAIASLAASSSDSLAKSVSVMSSGFQAAHSHAWCSTSLVAVAGSAIVVASASAGSAIVEAPTSNGLDIVEAPASVGSAIVEASATSPVVLPPLPPPALDLSASAVSFQDWLRRMPSEALSDLISSAEAFAAIEREWYETRRGSFPKGAHKSKRKRMTVTSLDHRIAVGLDFAAWRSRQTDKKILHSAYRAFARQRWNYDAVPDGIRQWVKRCDASARKASASLSPNGNIQVASGYTSGRKARRARLNQGRPFKLGVMRSELFDWFVSVKASVSARLPAKVVKAKAKELGDECLQEMRRTGEFATMPIINKSWLARWKREYNIVLRKPNRKYKVSLAKLRQRMTCMWLTTFKIRTLGVCVFGHDLEMEGVDQKGIHMNELGSKNIGTLCIKGAPEVPLKENHAATRQRVSLMTTVTSSEARALRPGGPPLQILFKGMTHRTLAGLELPDGLPMFGPQLQPLGWYVSVDLGRICGFRLLLISGLPPSSRHLVPGSLADRKPSNGSNYSTSNH